MHEEILTTEQRELLPMTKHFSDRFGLVGGTAVALQIGHRQSVDFDLFSTKPFDNLSIRAELDSFFHVEQELVNRNEEVTVLIHGVKYTFFYFPFPITFTVQWPTINMADLLTVGAMKAYALKSRGKWKDYVDLYFILHQNHSVSEIARKAQELFGEAFNEKIFRTQLGYFFDIDIIRKPDPLEFMPGFTVPRQAIEDYLKEASLN